MEKGEGNCKSFFFFNGKFDGKYEGKERKLRWNIEKKGYKENEK